MAYDLPNRWRSENVRADAFSSPSSHILSHTEPTATSGHQKPPRSDARKEASFFARKFGAQGSNKDETRGPLGLRCLFHAPETQIDLVFVHGLRGGSIKTWRFGEDEQLFWPRYWLPREAGFVNASIHSFGYDSDWGSTKPSILNVHDFGQSLYEELLTSPLLRHRSKGSPIILIGHSMGGLVIKKAYILAQDDQKHPELARRIRSIFFLATPHRGSDYAAVLNNVLKYCGLTGLTSSREYIQDITTGSVSTQVINNDFARYAKDLTVYSFCETLPTIGGSSALIVEKASAVLGLHPKNEHIQYLRANHRDVCKFRSRQESNYIIVKNALATAVEDLVHNVITVNNQVTRDQMREVEDLLHIQHIPEEYHDKLKGSCQWMESREDFRTWIGAEHKEKTTLTHRPSIFWVQAQPGAGKTVLATHVISRLRDSCLPFASHLFHFGKKAAQTLAGLLQSLALQMASANKDIREKLAEIYANAPSFDRDDSRAIWHKIFLGGIFQVSISSPQFWVIDALDECVKYAELFNLLKGIQSQFPLRIFMTSRKLPDMPRLLRMLESCEVGVVEIPATDTMNDINLYVRSRIADLPIDEDNEREKVAMQILAKSGTSFLWTRLVMDELEGVYGYDSITQVLQEIPEGMSHYYKRAVAEMSEKKREQHRAKAILLWVMLATRPLLLSELAHALHLDTEVQFLSSKSAVEGLCGQLVSVEVQTGLVHPVHATAREFILSQEAGAFQVSPINGNEKIVLTCLRLLTGPDMQPPRHRRLLIQKRIKPPILSALANYAITQFSEHLLGASAESDPLFLALDRFLKTTVLTWIERIMIDKKAYHLLRTAKNIKAYSSRRSMSHPSLDNTVGAWAVDITRIVSNFGRALLRSPDSVYFLIPPLCPMKSAIFQQFGKPADGISLSGYRRSDWDDCIASVRFKGEEAVAVGCINSLIAVGMESGALHLYNSRSYQKERIIFTDFSIEQLHFDISGSFVAVSSRKVLGVWEMNGNLRWKTQIRHRCILLSSSQDRLVGVTAQGRLYQWDIETGELLNEQIYTYRAPVSDTVTQTGVGKVPTAASISPEFDLIAFTYRNSPTCVFEYNSGDLIAWAIDENNRAAEHVIFNPDPDVSLLLVAYNESHLALYDSWSGQLVASVEAERHVILNSVACSPDGHTFACMDIQGHLQIWDFESLTLLYHVLVPNSPFNLLHFTSDGLGILHVANHELKVWAPSALVRKTVEMDDETISGNKGLFSPVAEGQFEQFQASKIRSLIAHPLRPILFTGNHNGDVMIYHSSHDYQPLILYTHNGNSVQYLAASRQDVIASADIHANLIVRRFDSPERGPPLVETPLIVARLSSPVTQLIFDVSGKYLMVSTIHSDYVYSVEDGVCIGWQDASAHDPKTRKWFVVTEQDYCDHFLLIADEKVTAFSAQDFSAQPKTICGTSNIFAETGIKSITGISGTLRVTVETQQAYSDIMSTFVLTLSPWAGPAQDATTILIPSDLCALFLGTDKDSDRIIFLHPEMWVCSASFSELEAGKYSEHFFVPEEYNSLNSELNRAIHPVQTADGDFAFCIYDKVVVMKGGLKFQVQRLHAEASKS